MLWHLAIVLKAGVFQIGKSSDVFSEKFRYDCFKNLDVTKDFPVLVTGQRPKQVTTNQVRKLGKIWESFRLTASRVARDKPCSTQCKKSHGIPSSPRAAAFAKLRLLTGHDCLCAHLFRFNLVTSPICVLCDTGQDMTAAHLGECSALNDLNCIVKRYWRARCLMT
ncbi:uncharacterized protein TNCV_120811 [Trichonephila clavipes]|nr:uncharacterized protein TNCV_120811 [Trichonephila clavipes]